MKKKTLAIVLGVIAGAVLIITCASTVMRYTFAYWKGVARQTQSGKNMSQTESGDLYTDFSVPDFDSMDLELPDFSFSGEESAEKETGTGAGSENQEDENAYRNTDIGIGFDLDHNWIRYSEEMIRILYNMTSDAIDDSSVTDGTDSGMYDIMAATLNGKTHFNVTVEYMGALSVLMDVEDYVEQMKELLLEYYPKMGYENVRAETTLLEFLGDEYNAICVSADIDSVPFYLCEVLCVLNDYAVSVTVSSQEEEDVYDTLGKFYRLEGYEESAAPGETETNAGITEIFTEYRNWTQAFISQKNITHIRLIIPLRRKCVKVRE